jgi:hypothetical protein
VVPGLDDDDGHLPVAKIRLWPAGRGDDAEDDDMPSVSEKQRRAMQAAAHGNSTLGIPAKVGREFAAADSAKRKRGPFKLPVTKRREKR